MYSSDAEYLSLFKILGLKDPKTFFIESVCRNIDSNQVEYRRQTGQTTEIMVGVIYEALLSVRKEAYFTCSQAVERNFLSLLNTAGIKPCPTRRHSPMRSSFTLRIKGENITIHTGSPEYITSTYSPLIRDHY